jgi:flagellar basal-body rod protein FlgB
VNIEPIAGSTTTLVRLALDAAQMRHRAHVTNIANAGVPGYAPVRLDFGDALARAQAQLAQNPGDAEIQALSPDVVLATDPHGRPIGSVELDVEMADMVHNAMDYQALLKGLSRHLSILSMAISDGRR